MNAIQTIMLVFVAALYVSLAIATFSLIHLRRDQGAMWRWLIVETLVAAAWPLVLLVALTYVLIRGIPLA